MNFSVNKIVDQDIQNILKDLDLKEFYGKSILVTGAAGFIPSYIVYTLLALNDKSKNAKEPLKVLALVRNKERAIVKFANLLSRSDFELIVSDVSDVLVCKELVCENVSIDIIIHAASQASPKYYGVDPVGTIKANTLGTINLLELARKKKTQKFLYISSGEVYGVLDDTISQIKETYTGNVDITNVRSCYAESKRLGETLCVCYGHQYGIHTNMLRLSHTYGPLVKLDDGRVFADFTNCVVQNKNIILNSNGSAKRSFVYITDMIKALFVVLKKAPKGEAYNIASDTETSILDLAKTICALYPEKHLNVEYKKNTDPGYIQSQSSSAKLCTEKLKELGWKQTIAIDHGFKRMIDSYIK